MRQVIRYLVVLLLTLGSVKYVAQTGVVFLALRRVEYDMAMPTMTFFMM